MASDPNDSKGSSNTKFYQEDVVQRVGSANSYGVVMRCWHDADDHLPSLSTQEDPLMRPLQHGEVGVSFFPNGAREILPESNFVLIDRSFQPGDLCKRSIDDVRSGVVTGVDIKARLVHAISGEPIEGWRSLHEFKKSTTTEIGDYVLCDDWVGQVIELFDESLIEIGGGLVKLPELSSRLSVGDRGGDILPPATNVSSMLSFLIGNSRSATLDTVLDVKHTVIAICWLAINQTLDPAEAQNCKRPDRFWHGENLSRLTLIKTRSDQDVRVGDKVYMNDVSGIPTTTHGQEGDPIGIVVVHALTVKETCTSAQVLWQDGTSETLKSTELIPYLNPDEYDCWPGDHVFYKNEDHSRAAVVQFVNANERVASIRYIDNGSTELISVLELDPHGTSTLATVMPHTHLNSLGVRRGDFVFIHREGSTNGVEKPRVPRIGEVEAWVRENPMTPEGILVGWRREMADIGSNLAATQGAKDHVIKRPFKGNDSLSWCGEVTNLRLDGTIEVMHPNSTVSVYPLERLTKLYDGIEQLEDDAWDDEMSEVGDSAGENDDGVWLKDDKGVWRYHLHEIDADEWEETDDDDDGEDDDDLMDVDDDAEYTNEFMDISPPESSHPDTPPPLPESATSLASSIVDTKSDVLATVDNHDDSETDVWKRFDVLASAPHDHAFYSSTPAQPSKAFLSRLNKEYRVLASSLPDSIIVRAYEDRTDLLRSVIIGPDNTPYEDAPFVIDWMLDSNFPHSPPIAHFLSWTNGNGRVNPNLYEEGKVCLSILGTWAGDKSETWSAARSSLLQAFVSIQGLVLVKEPWFCEPAYEKLRGTEEGIVNSRLYNEKAYCLSRGFVRRALEIPPGGLESDISWFYYTHNRLEKVVCHSKALIAKSKLPAEDHEDSELAVPRLTVGGIITLERTLNKLQALLDEHR